DGGGSATLVGRDDDGEPVLLNRPSGVSNMPGTLRAVVASLGFTNLRRSEQPIPHVADWEAAWYIVLWTRAYTWARLHPATAALLIAIALLSLAVLIQLWRRHRRRRARARGAAARC